MFLRFMGLIALNKHEIEIHPVYFLTNVIDLIVNNSSI